MFVCRRCTARLLKSTKLCTRSNTLFGTRSYSVASIHTLPSRGQAQDVVHKRPSQRRRSMSKLVNSQSLQKYGYSTTSNPPRPFRLAIIGSGPAGFYTASKVLKHNPGAKIDMYERLPVPYGLVRYGVAPDHPEVKNCQDRFDEIAESPGFDFIGNVDVGGQIPLDIMRRHYDAFLFTYGASEDRTLGIPGEDLKGVWSARSFVAWYNGLPGYDKLDFELDQSERAVVIGQGNVSLDVARILLTPVDDLRKTDIPEHVLQTLSQSRIKRASAVGRRGPLQAAFTIKEIRELTAISDATFNPIDPSFFPSNLKELPRARKRIAELLLKASKAAQASGKPLPKTFSLDFLQSPIQFDANGSRSDGQLGSVTFQHQTFADGADPFDPAASVKPISDKTTTIETSLAFRSIGYKPTPLPGLSDLGIQFDTRKGIIPNERGRVVVHPTGQPGIDVVPQTLPGLYVAGWVKRGPTGVIASTMEDAFATADCITHDLDAGHPFLNGRLDDHAARDGWQGVLSEVQDQDIDLRRTDWRDWRAIDLEEKARGAQLGKEREKITSVEDMLKVLG